MVLVLLRKRSPTLRVVSIAIPKHWLRVRMPISDDLHPRNFITKISKYERVVNIPNSMSVLHDLLPASIEMTVHGLKVVFRVYLDG